MSIVCDTMHQLELFQYTIALNFNMGYYTIYIFPQSKYMTTIVNGFLKFGYNMIPMEMCASGDIF